MTAEQDCWVSKTLKIIGSKWTILILHELCGGTKRFGQLQRALPGISPKTLSERLQQLEKNKIITKKIFAEIPLHVEYTLTEKGKSLKVVIDQMALWGQQTDIKTA
ncbi:MAG: helix-turn-helix domain-containing protein [Patescibacteria group bacterium]